MNDKTEQKLELLFGKYLAPWAASTRALFLEIEGEDEEVQHEKLSTIISAISFLINRVSEDGRDLMNILINLVGNICDITFKSATKYYDEKQIKEMRETLRNNMAKGVMAMLVSLHADGDESLEEKLNELCDCPDHKAMREKSIH